METRITGYQYLQLANKTKAQNPIPHLKTMIAKQIPLTDNIIQIIPKQNAHFRLITTHCKDRDITYTTFNNSIFIDKDDQVEITRLLNNF
jgi:hypothetical protein